MLNEALDHQPILHDIDLGHEEDERVSAMHKRIGPKLARNALRFHKYVGGWMAASLTIAACRASPAHPLRFSVFPLANTILQLCGVPTTVAYGVRATANDAAIALGDFSHSRFFLDHVRPVLPPKPDEFDGTSEAPTASSVNERAKISRKRPYHEFPAE